MIGAFLGDCMSSFGRRKCLIMMCLLTIVGNFASLFYDTYILVLLGKLISGISTGGIMCFGPKYTMDCSPREVSGSTGALVQVAICVGIFLNSLIALPYGDKV